MQLLFSRRHMNVYYCNRNKNYIVYNTNKEWKNKNGECGHTHVNTYQQALYLVDCAIHKKIPRRVNMYFLVSLIRLSTDTKYIEKIQKRIDNEPKKSYRNVPRNFLKNRRG